MKHLVFFTSLLLLPFLVSCTDDDSSSEEGEKILQAVIEQLNSTMYASDGSPFGIEDANSRIIAISSQDSDDATVPSQVAYQFYNLLISSNLNWHSFSSTTEGWQGVKDDFVYSYEIPGNNGTIKLEGSKAAQSGGMFATITLDLPGYSKVRSIKFAGDSYLTKVAGENPIGVWYSLNSGNIWEGYNYTTDPFVEQESDAASWNVCMKKISEAGTNAGEVDYSALLSEDEWSQILKLLPGVDKASLLAFVNVQSSGRPAFCDQSASQPTILFNGHLMWKNLSDLGIDPNSLSHQYPEYIYPKYSKAFYQYGKAEYVRFIKASAINSDAAILSSQWGMFQILGSDYKKCGESTLADFVKAMSSGNYQQIRLLAIYLNSINCVVDIAAKNWTLVAKKYNGKTYQQSNIDKKLKKAYDSYK